MGETWVGHPDPGLCKHQGWFQGAERGGGGLLPCWGTQIHGCLGWTLLRAWALGQSEPGFIAPVTWGSQHSLSGPKCLH